MQGPARIAPSVLAADMARLGEEVAAVEEHVDLLHVDVMDGHLVDNIALGFPVVEALRRITHLPLDCHMMTTNPAWYLERLAALGVTWVTVHLEAHPDPRPVAARARELGLGFGLVLDPPTPVGAVEPFLELCDLVLVMAVPPGFGGQSFDPGALEKISRLRKSLDSAALSTDIEVDGGIDPTTARLARKAGAEVFVAGTAVFGRSDPVAAVTELRRAVGET